MKTLILSLLFSVLAWAEVPEHLYLKEAPPIQLPNSARYMVYLETSENPVGKRSPRPFWIEHLEIPLASLQEDIGAKMAPEIRESMIFQNAEGVKMVRWILNPEDTKYANEIIEKMKDKGLNLEKKRYFIGYSTSSRSCIVQDPKTGTTFSIKSSTNQTAGNWNDKKETVRAARAGRLMNDHIERDRKSGHNSALGIINEPLAYYMPEVDQGIIIRQYEHFLRPNQDKKLVPVFAFIHRAEFYAAKAGYDVTQPGATQEFIEKTLAKWGGIASAELFMHYGIIYNSPHGQNFLVEVDKNERPTGKLFARDYADSHLYEPIFKRSTAGRAALAHYRTFTSGSNEIVSSNFRLIFGPYHNGTYNKPSWVHNEALLIDAYRDAVNDRIQTTLKLSNPSASLSNANGTVNNYWGATYNLEENKDLKEWIKDPVYTARAAQSRVSPAEGRVRSEMKPVAKPVIRSCRMLMSSI
ncbi:MAG: hypothetical protein K0R29_400 [Pseudobdellovibrio sp.]|jgi:hypothetical protein|nr:hypothetical protein [Pseudobdellovibrio sp.]